MSGRSVVALLVSLLLVPLVAFADSRVVASGLAGPIKIDQTERGSLVVSEQGSGNNDGRVSVVDRNGSIEVLLGGLPSAIDAVGGPSGPSAVLVRGCCIVDVAISEGDTLRFPGGVPGPQEVPNPQGPMSPLFSSVLRIAFSYPIDQLMGGFELSHEDHGTLADGFPVRLANGHGETALVRVIADFKDFRADANTNVRASSPFGMTAARLFDGLMMVNSGQNAVVRVNPLEQPKILLRFAQVANPAGVAGPPFTDAVPTSVHYFRGDSYLVTLFAGAPFAPGTSSVRVVDVAKRTESPLITGLSSAIDVLPIGSSLYVLELFSGRLLRFATPSSAPVEVATGLVGPTSMVYDARQRALFITELFAGQIRRVDL